MTSAPDEDVRRLLAEGGYRRAFDLLVSRYWKKVFRLCFSYVRDAGTAEDLTQDAFLRVWRSLPSYNGKASPSTWLYVISRNVCLSHLRKPARSRTFPLDDPAIQAEADRVRHQRPREEASLDLETMLAKLGEEQRQVLALFYLEGKSCDEVAEMLGIASGTVRSRLFRARRALAGMAEPPGSQRKVER